MTHTCETVNNRLPPVHRRYCTHMCAVTAGTIVEQTSENFEAKRNVVDFWPRHCRLLGPTTCETFSSKNISTNAIWKVRRRHNKRTTYKCGIKKKKVTLRKILRNKRRHRQRADISPFSGVYGYTVYSLFFTCFARFVTPPLSRCPLSISRLCTDAELSSRREPFSRNRRNLRISHNSHSNVRFSTYPTRIYCSPYCFPHTGR